MKLLPGLYEAELRAVPAGKVERLSRGELDALTGPSAIHQGVVFDLSPLPEISLKSFLETAKGPIVVLDEVVDPQNMGAVLRVAETVGAAGLICSERRSAPLSPAARKASAGASELVPVIRVTNLRRALLELKDAEYWIVGTSLGEKSVDLFNFEFPAKCALVLGSEGAGMRELTTKECDFLVTLPMWGQIESLNVSHAAAVVLYEYRRQMHTIKGK